MCPLWCPQGHGGADCSRVFSTSSVSPPTAGSHFPVQMGLLAALLVLIIVMVGAVTYMVMQVYSFRCVSDTLLLGHDMRIPSFARPRLFSQELAHARFNNSLPYAHGLTTALDIDCHLQERYGGPLHCVRRGALASRSGQLLVFIDVTGITVRNMHGLARCS